MVNSVSDPDHPLFINTGLDHMDMSNDIITENAYKVEQNDVQIDSEIDESSDDQQIKSGNVSNDIEYDADAPDGDLVKAAYINNDRQDYDYINKLPTDENTDNETSVQHKCLYCDELVQRLVT